MTHDLFRTLPQVERTLEDPRVAAWCAVLSRPLVARIVADTLAVIREEIRQKGAAPEEPEVLERIDGECRLVASRRIRKVVNATGIILHTNMGRAPLPRSAWEAAASANTGDSNLESTSGQASGAGETGSAPTSCGSSPAVRIHSS